MEPSIRFEYLQGFDPFEYDIVLIIDEADNKWDINLACLTTSIDTKQATEMVRDFSSIVDFVVSHPQQTVGGVLSSLR